MDARSCSTVFVALLLLFVGAGTAFAQAPSDAERDRRARLHFDSATVHFETGDYESALEGYRASYAESPHPEILYNIFLCEERLGNLAAAVEALEAFLATDAVPNRPVLERRLAHLRERRARGETRIEDRSDASTDETAQPTRGHPIDPETRAVPAPPPPQRDDSLAIAGFSVAAAGVVGFAISGGLTLAEDARLRDGCAPHCTAAEVETIGVTRVIADVSAGVALAGAIVGVIGLVISPGASDAPASAGVRVRGLGLEGTF